MKRRTQFSLTLVILFLFVISSVGLPRSYAMVPSSGQLSQLNRLGDPKISAVLDLIDEDLLREYLTTLVGFAPRMTGTYGCEKSAEYMHEQFHNMGLESRLQNWTAFGNIYHPLIFTSQNVEGILPGDDPTDDSVLVFGAHYDTVRTTPGANDDGSGTAAVLAAAYALSHFSFQRTIKFVAFAGEEIGLRGSQAYAKEAYQNQENIMLDIQADMIGHATTLEGSHRMGLTVTEDAPWVFDVFETINTDFEFGFNFSKGDIGRTGKGYSDYFPFVEYGWEALACWDGEHDPAMHSADDNLDNINFSYLVNTTKIIAGSLAYLADTTETYPQVQIESPRFGFLYRNGMIKRTIKDLKITVLNDIWIWAEVKYATAPINHAEFYYDDTLVFTDTEAPFKWECNIRSVRTHRITVIVYDELGRKSTDWRDIRFINLLLKR